MFPTSCEVTPPSGSERAITGAAVMKPSKATESASRLCMPGLLPLQRHSQLAADLADDATAEREDTDHEDRALRHGNPLAELRQIIFHRGDEHGTHHGAEHRPQSA